jgi:hypothetical protein
MPLPPYRPTDTAPPSNGAKRSSSGSQSGPTALTSAARDGYSWQPLDNGNWNALSLPFVVGPHGRIGKLNAEALAR